MNNEKNKLPIFANTTSERIIFRLRLICVLALAICLLGVIVVNYFSLTSATVALGVVGLFLIITLVYLQTCIDAKQGKRLLHYQQLEHWAHAAKISGNIRDIDDDCDVAGMINTLLLELKEARNNDVLLDQTMRERALLDLETGIGNREYFNSRLEALLKEEEAQGAVLLLQFNDCELVHALYGPQQALSVLEGLIQACRCRLSHLSNYFIARRGQFELAILIPNIFADEAEKLVKRLFKNLMSVPLPVGIHNEEFVHIGVSFFTSKHKPYQVMSEADMALRSAQLQGPSHWFMFDEGDIERGQIKGSLKWRTMLEKSIEKNAFVIFFQPVISCDHGTIIHHEVLSKVRNHDGNLISARVFLPMARKCGLTKEIDLLVLEQVCRLLSYETSQHEDCSINLSIESLLNKDFVESLIAILIKNRTIAPRIYIEVSEYHLANHLAELSPVLGRIGEYGVKLIADKVGQFVVSAQYLKELPVQAIKLHRSIVIDIHRKVENQIFVQSITAISRPRNIALYALGVESKDEWMALVRLGIDGGQGHFFTEPVAQVAKAIHLPE
ncbi:EAL domain-containing protein [Thalassotalea fusca]